MAEVFIQNVCKQFGDFFAAKDVNLHIRDGEFVVFVGPSGCGKSTTLRMIAGLEETTSGTISIDGLDVTHLTPMDRDVAMVFQNYALYPHMSVYDNMAFGLKMRKFSKEAIKEKILDTAKMLELTHLLGRKPRQLSGGQRQRVALGRAVVRQPKVFLFDEPLSNLDAKLRVQMRAGIKKLQQTLGTTAIYVTHDQVEAMTLGDRVVIMRDGTVQQIGAPLELYNDPANKFVAGFVGSPSMNFLEVEVLEEGGVWTLKGSGFRLEAGENLSDEFKAYLGKRLTMGFRPAATVRAKVGAKKVNQISGRVDLVEHLGSEMLIEVNIGGCTILAEVGPLDPVKAGDEIKLSIDPDALRFFDPATEVAVRPDFKPLLAPKLEALAS